MGLNNSINSKVNCCDNAGGNGDRDGKGDINYNNKDGGNDDSESSYVGDNAAAVETTTVVLVVTATAEATDNNQL